MKDELNDLSLLQQIFLEKCMTRISRGGFKVYGDSTIAGLEIVIQRGEYRDSQRGWLNSLRRDYITEFCR
jgi:hypothetical protein